MIKNRINWTKEEDDIIRTCLGLKQINSWVKISKILKRKLGLSSKTAKQCRERFVNFLKHQGMMKQNNSWTEEEEKVLFQQFNIEGSKWVKIAKSLPGRSQNNIKNKYYGCLRKLVRKINKIQKQNGHTSRSQVKYQSVVKFLDKINSQNLLMNLSKKQVKIQQFLELKNQILKLVLNIDSSCQPIFLSIARKIHEFNTLYRFVCKNKSKKIGKIQKTAESQCQQIRKFSNCQETQKQNSEFQAIEGAQKVSHEQYKQQLQNFNGSLNHQDEQKYLTEFNKLSDIFFLQQKWQKQESLRLKDFVQRELFF